MLSSGDTPFAGTTTPKNISCDTPSRQFSRLTVSPLPVRRLETFEVGVVLNKFVLAVNDNVIRDVANAFISRAVDMQRLGCLYHRSPLWVAVTS